MESQLLQTSNQYFQGKPPTQMKSLTVLLNEGCAEGVLTKVFDATIGQNGMPMPVQYRTTFSKYVISQVTKWAAENFKDLEDDDESDPTPGLDLWYEELEKLCERLPEPFFRLYNFDPMIENSDARIPRIKILEYQNAFVSEGTTGLMTWMATTEFVKWMLSGDHLSQASWILELGAGTGLLGIAIIKAFEKLGKFVATDGSARALENCQQNFAANLSPPESSKVSFESIDWVADVDKFQNMVSKHSCQLGGKGLLLGADIVFDVNLVPPLIDLINIFLDARDPAESSCLLSCTIRNEETIGVFRSKLEALGNRSARVMHVWHDEENGNGIILEIKANNKN